MNNAGKYLPIGSVILTKGGNKKIMITGYMGENYEKEAPIFDYIACLYPQGIVSSKSNLLFNHDDIEKICFLGYSDDEQKEYVGILNKYTKTEKDNT